MSKSQHARRVCVLVGAVISTWTFVAPSEASAATFTVNSLGDADDAVIDSVCDSDASTPGLQCTLRAAISEANASTGGARDLIRITATGTIMIGSQLLITNEVRIQGPGSGQLTIDRSDTVRHFWVQGAAGAYSFEGLTLQNGRPGAFGGSVWLSGAPTSVTFDDVRFLDNVAVFTADTNGGAVYITATGAITFRDTYFRGNYAQGNGGAIYAQGGTAGLSVVIESSTFFENESVGAAGGGAVMVRYANNSVAVRDSVFESNSSNGPGAGLFLDDGAVGVVEGCTFIDNEASYSNTGAGGAVYARQTNNYVSNSLFYGNRSGAGGAVLLTNTWEVSNVTIVGNSSTNGAYAGLRTLGTGTVRNSVMTGNTVSSGDEPDCSTVAAFTSGGYNFVGDGNGCGWGGNDTTGAAATLADPMFDVLLGAAQEPRYLPPGSGSPLVDGGDPGGCRHTRVNASFVATPNIMLTTDQAGGTRAVDGGSGSARCDIGAIEAGGLGTVGFASASVTASEGDGTVSLTVTRSGSTTAALDVPWALVAGSATAGSDYTDASGTLQWAAGDGADKTIDVALLDDSATESDETLTVRLTPVRLIAGNPAEATLTIEDDDVATGPDGGLGGDAGTGGTDGGPIGTDGGTSGRDGGPGSGGGGVGGCTVTTDADTSARWLALVALGLVVRRKRYARRG